jgi:hypothetical protein
MRERSLRRITFPGRRMPQGTRADGGPPTCRNTQSKCFAAPRARHVVRFARTWTKNADRLDHRSSAGWPRAGGHVSRADAYDAAEAGARQSSGAPETERCAMIRRHALSHQAARVLDWIAVERAGPAVAWRRLRRAVAAAIMQGQRQLNGRLTRQRRHRP